VRIIPLKHHLMSMVYLITFCCYGSRVPGEENIVSRHNNLVGARLSAPSPSLATAARATMTEAAHELDSEERQVVLQTTIEVCRHRAWTLLAAHVRTAHLHVVVAAEGPPERIMHALKSYSSRALNCRGRWARHGSTVYLWTRDEFANAVRYVVSKQGEPMAVYTQPNPDRKGGDFSHL
jgi:REP element-mobilizing transposase RayT